MVQPSASDTSPRKKRSPVDMLLWGVVVSCLLFLLWPVLQRGQSWAVAYLAQRQLRASAPVSADLPTITGPERERWPFTRIIIPRINLDAVVLDAMDEKSLTYGPGHDPLSSGPGRGNCVIAGHRNLGQWWFYHLDNLRPGDAISLQTMGKTYRYEVQNVRTVPDSALHLLKPHGKKPILTLYTCTVPKTPQRILVSAVLVED